MEKNKTKFIPKLLIFMFLVTSAFWLGCESKTSKEDSALIELDEEVTPVNLTINAEATYLLKRSLDNLSGLTKFSVQTQTSFEDLFDYGYRVNYETSGNIIVNRPNKIRINRFGLEMHQVFYYDGENLTLHNPYEKVYGAVPLKGTIESMLHTARDVYGFTGPAGDLVYDNSYALLMNGVNYAEVVGKEMIEGVMCDHLIFGQPEVSFQIWTSENEPYLPYKYVVTDISTPQLLSFAITMTDWDTPTDMEDALFEFIPSEETAKIEFLKVDQEK